MDDLSDLDACTAAVFKTVSTGTVQEVRDAIDNYQIPDKDKERYRDKLDYLRCQHNKRYQSLLHYAAMYNSEDVQQLLITDFKFRSGSTDRYMESILLCMHLGKDYTSLLARIG